MAALPDAESPGIVSLVLKTMQARGMVVEAGWGEVSTVEPPEAGCNLKGLLGLGDMGRATFSRSELPCCLIPDALSGHDAA